MATNETERIDANEPQLPLVSQAAQPAPSAASSGSAGAGVRDEERVHGRDLLPVELGIVVLVEQEQPHDAGREAGDSAQLAGIDGVDDVHDLRGRDTYDVANKARVGHVPGCRRRKW